jgi:hypothetical protein
MPSICCRRLASALALLGLCVTAGAATPAAANSGPDLPKRLASFEAVSMPYDTSALTTRQQRMVAKLLEATRYLDELFWEQSDPEALKLYRSLAASKLPRDQQLRRLLVINGGRYDLIRDNQPFAGAAPRPPGANLFPADLTRAEFDAYVAQHPEQKAALYDPFTVVRRQGAGLAAIPYHVAYRKWLTPMVRALRAAADLSDDAAFARFLRMRADALLNDEYFASDLAWLDLVNPRFDVIFAPYETYLDDFLGVKTSYGAAVLIRNDAESRKLEVFQKFVPDIQDALPLAAEDRPSKQGHATPMEVMEAPLRGGDLRHGYQAVADNLPNDPRVHEQKGTKKIFFSNFMDARVNHVILPIARRLLDQRQAQLATVDGYVTFVLMHEIAHGIGPAYARTAAGRKDIREAIGPGFSALEESKADIVALYGLKWLADHGDYAQDKLIECYASRVADIFRTVRFGVAEAHGHGDVMQFNFLVERGVISFDGVAGRYLVDLARMPDAVAALTRELLEQEATGDRARTESWFARYGSMPPQLAKVLEGVTDVPVDIDPVSAAEAP